jgi:hypothetical protein
MKWIKDKCMQMIGNMNIYHRNSLSKIKDKWIQIVGQSKLISYNDAKSKFKGHINNNFWAQNLDSTKIIVGKLDSSNDEILLDVGRQNRLKFLLLGEDSYIEKNIISDKFEINKNKEQLRNYINELNKKNMFSLMWRKIKINNYQNYAAISILLYIASIYVYWKYMEEIKNIIKQYKVLSIFVISFIIIKKLFWTVVIIGSLYKKHTFVLKLK